MKPTIVWKSYEDNQVLGGGELRLIAAEGPGRHKTKFTTEIYKSAGTDSLGYEQFQWIVLSDSAIYHDLLVAITCPARFNASEVPRNEDL